MDDLNQTYFTPTQLGVFLNNALRETQKLLVGAGQQYYVSCVQTTLVVNQRNYALPQDFEKLTRLEILVNGTVPNENTIYMSPIAPNQRDLLPYSTGTPGCYYFKNNALVVYPAPDVALTMRLEYVYRVAEMTLDTDMPDCPEEFQELIAVIAARDCLIKDTRESPLLDQKLQMYIDRLKIDAAQRNIDESRSVIVTGSYAGTDYNFY